MNFNIYHGLNDGLVEWIWHGWRIESRWNACKYNLGWKQTKSHYNPLSLYSSKCFASSSRRLFKIVIKHCIALFSPLEQIASKDKQMQMPTWWIKCLRKLLDRNVIDETGMGCCSIVDRLIGCTECLFFDSWCNVELSITKNYTTTLKAHLIVKTYKLY